MIQPSISNKFAQKLRDFDKTLSVRWNGARWEVWKKVNGPDFPSGDHKLFIWEDETGDYVPLCERLFDYLASIDTLRHPKYLTPRGWWERWRAEEEARKNRQKAGFREENRNQIKYAARAIKREFQGLSHAGAVIPKTRDLNG